MKPADSNKLSELHSELAKVLLAGLRAGGEPSAAILNVARQFLKDNDITADLAADREVDGPLSKLADALEDFDEEDAVAQ